MMSPVVRAIVGALLRPPAYQGAIAASFVAFFRWAGIRNRTGLSTAAAEESKLSNDQ